MEEVSLSADAAHIRRWRSEDGSGGLDPDAIRNRLFSSAFIGDICGQESSSPGQPHDVRK
jgi:hypothetical protein